MKPLNLHKKILNGPSAEDLETDRTRTSGDESAAPEAELTITGDARQVIRTLGLSARVLKFDLELLVKAFEQATPLLE